MEFANLVPGNDSPGENSGGVRKDRKDSSVSDLTDFRKSQGIEKMRKQLCALIANYSLCSAA